MINVEKVTRTRKHQGRTVNWLSSRIGVHYITYSNWVKDGSIPEKYADAIAHALGIPKEDLTNDD